MTLPVLSKRLRAVADMAPRCGCVSDIGTDHGYIPVYLVCSGKADRAVAADLRPGPLSAARANVNSFGLSDRISVRLSDGLGNISAEEAQVIVIAGMGGMLTVRILSEGKELMRGAKACILEPQSDIDSVRRFLLSEGMMITAEEMVSDAGKYYTVMRAEYSGDGDPAGLSAYGHADLMYGKLLIDSGDKVLEEKLDAGRVKTMGILRALEGSAPAGDAALNPRTEARIEELREELGYIDEALSRIRRKNGLENI